MPVSQRASLALAIALSAMLGACANGDFGRIKPALVTDDIHAWVGTEAARGAGVPISRYPLTDDERRLRDVAYPLIEPPYDRNRWYSILNEYGASRVFPRDWASFDPTAYGVRLMAMHYRSATARYAQLNTDIRNDVVRIPPFFVVASRVLDLDRKRQKSLDYVSALTEEERVNAIARIAENALVVSWVQRSLDDRAESYRHALERLVIATPAPMAVETERSLTLLRTRIAEYRVIAGPDFAPRTVAHAVPSAMTPDPSDPAGLVSK